MVRVAQLCVPLVTRVCCAQVRVAQLCGSELDGLTVSQLEELERMQAEALRR